VPVQRQQEGVVVFLNQKGIVDHADLVAFDCIHAGNSLFLRQIVKDALFQTDHDTGFFIYKILQSDFLITDREGIGGIQTGEDDRGEGAELKNRDPLAGRALDAVFDKRTDDLLRNGVADPRIVRIPFFNDKGQIDLTLV